VSELRSVLEPLQREVLGEVPDASLEQDFAELEHTAALLELERLRRLVEIERRGLWARDGHLSTASWLVARFGRSHGSAKATISLARSLEQMPATRHGITEGRLSPDAARVLVRARFEDPEAFEAAEEAFVQAASGRSVAELTRIAQAWHQQVASERDPVLEEVCTPSARRRLHASVSFEGMVRLDGDLDPEAGEALLTALSAVIDAEVRAEQKADAGQDRRTPAQRRADALGEICRGWLDHTYRPSVGGERPHLVLTVPVKALGSGEGPQANRQARAGSGHPAGEGSGAEAAVAGGSAAQRAVEGSVAMFDHVGPVPPEVLERLACDASIRRVVIKGRSEPLDVGRKTPVVSPAMRRAVIVRDRDCRFPGCDRPPPWCDCHHVRHWIRHGPNAVRNLVLLCRRHHRFVHEGRFGVEMIQGQPVFRRPDGTVLEDRSPP